MYPVEKPKKRPWVWLLCILGVLLLLMGIVFGVLFGYNRFTLSLTPGGEREIVLDYGTPYQEYGASPYFYGSRFLVDGFTPDAEVRWEGTVNTEKTGTYYITYTADFFWWHAEAQRIVQVVDRRAPEIQLIGDPEFYIFPGATFEEPGFIATDEYDGDLTDKVEFRQEDGVVTYWVCDAAGNRAECTRILRDADPTPPEITLAGDDTVEIYTATTYEEPGFTAWDNNEGDITDRVTVEGTVNPYISGTYTLTYTVADVYQNTTTVTRTVKVIPRERAEQVYPDEKVIYLTFDDGPGPYTRELLDILAKYNAKATFFVVCNGFSDLIGEIADAGHSVGIHSASHDYGVIYASEEAYYSDIAQVQALICAETGSETTLLRFPGGSSNTVSRFNEGIMSRLTQSVRDAGFQYFDWNVDSNDAGGAKDADEVFENVVDGIGNRRIAIVLQHDVKAFSVEAVEDIILWGLAHGYEFRALDMTSPSAHHGINN